MAKFTRTVVATDKQGNRIEITNSAASETKCLKQAEKNYNILSLLDDVTVRYKRNSFVKIEG
jgi:signal transduction histidine kinase